MKHAVMFSGGIGSYVTAKRVVEEFGRDNTLLIFSDTLIEDEDLYRFLAESVEILGAELVHLKEGRDPWQVFFDERFLGNSRVDPCSKILKRQLIRKWIEKNLNPEEDVIYLGIDWSESHRFKKARRYWEPWNVASPLLDPPLLSKEQMLAILDADGIKRPRLYDMGFPHNNCGGFCIKAGMAHFKLLYERMPERLVFRRRAFFVWSPGVKKRQRTRVAFSC